MKGYNTSTTPAYLLVQRNGADYIWLGPEIPFGSSQEMFVEVNFVVPAGTTSLAFGARFSGSNAAVANDKIFINQCQVIKLDAVSAEYQYNLKDHLGNSRLTLLPSKI